MHEGLVQVELYGTWYLEVAQHQLVFLCTIILLKGGQKD